MSNGIKIGNLNIESLKVGSADCKVYLGDTLLYDPTHPTPTLQWVTFNNGDTIPSDLQIYGIKGSVNNLSLTFDNIGNDIYFERGPMINCYIGGVVSSCYTNSYIGLDNVELIFSNLGTCSDYYTLGSSCQVRLGAIQLYVYA